MLGVCYLVGHGKGVGKRKRVVMGDEFIGFVPVTDDDAYPVFVVEGLSGSAKVSHKRRRIEISSRISSSLHGITIERALKKAKSTYHSRFLAAPFVGWVESARVDQLPPPQYRRPLPPPAASPDL